MDRVHDRIDRVTMQLSRPFEGLFKALAEICMASFLGFCATAALACKLLPQTYVIVHRGGISGNTRSWKKTGEGEILFRFSVFLFFFRSQRWKKNEFYEPGYGYLHFLLEQPFLFFPFLGEEARRPKAGRSNLRPDSH